MLVRATKSFNCAYSPMPVIAGELVEAEDELCQTWIAIGCAEQVEITDLGIVPVSGPGDVTPLPDSGAITVIETPGLRRRGEPRKS
jgi:hypothetical protein